MLLFITELQIYVNISTKEFIFFFKVKLFFLNSTYKQRLTGNIAYLAAELQKFKSKAESNVVKTIKTK